MDPREIVESLRSRRQSIVGYLSDLVVARTENPPGDEYRAAAVVEAFFKRLGIPCETREQEKGRANIIGRLGSGQPRIAIVCHLDTVPAGDGWHTDPFQATLKNDRLYGRGSKDNKGSLAAAMGAIEFLKEHESELRGEVLLIGAADEECGSRLGTHFLMDSGALPKLDGVIVPDAGDNLATIDIAEKGLMFLHITCHGQQAHGSTPEAGANAIYPMAALALWFRRWKMPGGENPLFTPPTATRNVGVITGGAAPNMVPGLCEMKVDMRYLPGTDRAELLAAITNAIDHIERRYPGTYFELEPLTEEVPTAVSTDEPIFEALASAVETVTGRRPRPFGMGGATVAKQFIAAGIPAVGICPGDAQTEHKANEYIPVAEVVDFAAVLVICLLKLAGRK